MNKEKVSTVKNTQPVTRLGASVSEEPPMYMAMVSPGMPITVMRLEDCFAILPSFGMSDMVLEIPEWDLNIAFDAGSYVKAGDDSFLIGPAVVYRIDEFGDDMPVAVEDIYHLQELYVDHITTLCYDSIELPALRLEGGIIHV